MEDIWYERPSFDSVGRLTFIQMILTNDDDVKSMFLIFGQHNMFPMIEMDASFLRSPEDILKRLIRPDEDAYVVSLFCWNQVLFIVVF